MLRLNQTVASRCLVLSDCCWLTGLFSVGGMSVGAHATAESHDRETGRDQHSGSRKHAVSLRNPLLPERQYGLETSTYNDTVETQLLLARSYPPRSALHASDRAVLGERWTFLVVGHRASSCPLGARLILEPMLFRTPNDLH